MKKHFLTLAFGTIGFFLASCTVLTPLKPGAENVVITETADLPKCKALGPVVLTDVNGTSVGYTSHQHLEEEAANVVRNKTIQLGGNVVVITKHETTRTYDNQVNTHHVEGEAYSCPLDSMPKSMKPTPAYLGQDD